MRETVNEHEASELFKRSEAINTHQVSLKLRSEILSLPVNMASTHTEETFAKFISGLLRRTGLSSKRIEELTRPAPIADFAQAFVPSEVNPRSNYERLEFEGDVVVNLVVVEYIFLRFPSITDVGYATRIKHNLISKKQLGVMAMRLGFDRYARYGEKVKISLSRDPVRESNPDWLSLMEDIFEAFVGALVRLSNARWTRGVGYHLAFSFISSILDEMGVDTEYEKVYDPKTRLKEIYDQEGWGFNARSFRVVERSEGGVADGDKPLFKILVFRPGDARPYVELSGHRKMETEHAAAEKAIEALRKEGIIRRDGGRAKTGGRARP